MLQMDARRERLGHGMRETKRRKEVYRQSKGGKKSIAEIDKSIQPERKRLQN